MRSRSLVVGLFALVLSLGVAPPSERGSAMVAADHRLASEAGAEVLARGGNAVDAAVAAALSAGVVQPAGSGLGGGGFAVVHLPGREPLSLDFREVAPASASASMFRGPDGAVDPRGSTDGPSAVAVPGEPRGLAELVRRFGRLSLAAVAAPAIRQARDGFQVEAHLAGALSRTSYGEVRTLLAVGGRPAARGDRLTQAALARTLAQWARTGGEMLNAGPGAEAVASVSHVTVNDLAAYRPRDRAPLVGRFRGHTVITMAPPSSGGIALLQMLAVLDGFDLEALPRGSSEQLHLLAEVMKHAFADRAHFLGDPDFVEVPTARLLSEERRDAIRRSVWPARTFPPEHYGSLLAPPADAGTQHISVVDAEGAAVALTTTINNTFGSGVVVPAWGVILNDEMDDFSAAPGTPNAYGLVGSESNAIAPGKRPLSSMTPTVVLDGAGQVELVVGASGGPTIITATLQVLLDVLVYDLDPQEAVAAPRIHHQWLPDVLRVEPGFGADTLRALEARGHRVEVADAFSAVQAVARRDGALEGGSDPRKGGWPSSPAR